MEPYQDFAHIGPNSLAGQFIRRFWQPIMVAEDLLQGEARRVRVLSEHFTAFRGDSGDAHLVQDLCPHRLTRLHLGWIEEDCIRCFYHGWKFDGAGNCVDQPAEKDSFKDKVKIRAYPVREYIGLIFAYLGEGEAPEFPLFPEVDETTDAITIANHIVPCNYFQRIENDLDEVHVHYVHRVTTGAFGLHDLPDIEVNETRWGIQREGRRSETGANISRTGFYLMPNILMFETPPKAPPASKTPYWTLHLAWRVPVEDDLMMSFIINLEKGAGSGIMRRPTPDPDPLQLTEEVLAGRLRIQDIDPKYPGLFPVEDNVALAGQGQIVDRSIERLGQSDQGIILLRKIWERELKALSMGAALKSWKRPDDLLVKLGR